MKSHFKSPFFLSLFYLLYVLFSKFFQLSIHFRINPVNLLFFSITNTVPLLDSFSLVSKPVFVMQL